MSEQAVTTEPMLDQIVLFDIDGTLIDNNYEVTSKEIYDAIAYAVENDWQVGLSSDTPYERMKQWHKHFGANGPIIAEKGAHVVADTTKDANPDSLRNLFLELRDQAIGYFVDNQVKVWCGDPTALIRSGDPFPHKADPGEVVVLVNTYRRYSLGYFVRVISDDGAMVKSEAHTLQVHDNIRTLYPEGVEIHEDVNHDFGLVIASNARMNKRIGSIALIESTGSKRFAMIGNSYADYVGSDIATHLAVGDATAEYRRVADFVAAAPVTSGAVESLDHLTGRNRV